MQNIVEILTTRRANMDRFKAWDFFIPILLFLIDFASITEQYVVDRNYVWMRFNGPKWPNAYPEEAIKVGSDSSKMPLFIVTDENEENMSAFLPMSHSNDKRFTKILSGACGVRSSSSYWITIDESKPVSENILQHAIRVDTKRDGTFYIGKIHGGWVVKPIKKTANNYLIMRDEKGRKLELLQVNGLQTCEPAPAPIQSAQIRSQEAPAPIQSAQIRSRGAPASIQSPQIRFRGAPAPIQSAQIRSRGVPAPIQSPQIRFRGAPASIQSAQIRSRGAPAPIQSAQIRSRGAPASIQSAQTRSRGAPAPIQSDQIGSRGLSLDSMLQDIPETAQVNPPNPVRRQNWRRSPSSSVAQPEDEIPGRRPVHHYPLRKNPVPQPSSAQLTPPDHAPRMRSAQILADLDTGPKRRRTSAPIPPVPAMDRTAPVIPQTLQDLTLWQQLKQMLPMPTPVPTEAVPPGVPDAVKLSAIYGNMEIQITYKLGDEK